MDNQNHTHSFDITVVPPTCQATGYALHRCACGYEYKDQYTPMLPHQFTTTAQTDPTCTEAGLQQVRCDNCGTTEDRAIPPLGHDWGQWNVHVVPTCTEAGQKVRTCARCNANQTESVKPLGHKLVNPKKSATKKGMVECFCENCGQTVTKKTFGSRLKKWLITLAIIAALLAGAVFALSLFAPGIYHATMAQVCLLLNDYDDAYYHLNDLSRHCAKNCEEDSPEHQYHAKALEHAEFFVVITGKTIQYNADGEIEYTTKAKYDPKKNGIIERTYNKESEVTWKSEDNYNDDGKLISSTSGSGEEVYHYEYSYNKNGNLLSVTYYSSGKLQNIEQYSYSKNGQCISSVTYDDAGNVTEEYTYDENGNELSHKEYDSNGAVTNSRKYTYDNKGNLIEEEFSSSNSIGRYEYSYDANGNKILRQSYDAIGKANGKIEYTYNADGQLLLQTNYDAKGKVTSKMEGTHSEEGRTFVETSYDANGKMLSKQERSYNADGSFISSIGYDSTGSVVSETRYTYNKDGMPVSYYYRFVSTYYTREYRTEYEYDKHGNRTCVISYDADGNVERKTKYQDYQVVYLKKNGK